MGRSEETTPEITALLVRWSAGDAAAGEKVLPQVYPELRRIAAAYFAGERPGHTLAPTAVVHEAFLRLAGDSAIAWQSRSHFYGIAARVMRRVLVDHSRERGAAKRGGRAVRVALDRGLAQGAVREPDLAALDDALTDLAGLDPEGARIVELRFFGGLSHREIAPVLGVSERTVDRGWRRARAWLFRALSPGAADGA